MKAYVYLNPERVEYCFYSLIFGFYQVNNHIYFHFKLNNKTVMSSYHQILYHIIFRTKDCRKTLTQTHTKELYAYITGIIKTKTACFIESMVWKTMGLELMRGSFLNKFNPFMVEVSYIQISVGFTHGY